MTPSKLPAHYIYTCRRCNDIWLEENETERSVLKNKRCMSCGSSQLNMSAGLPLSLAHSLLRNDMVYTAKNVSKLIEDNSAGKWKQKRASDRLLFENQIELLNHIYNAMLTNNVNV